MRLTKILPYVLMASCASTRVEGPRIRAPLNPRIADSIESLQRRTSLPYITSHYSNITEATQRALSTNPQIAAFGEHHESGALHIFADNILPLLAEHNYRDLILENLPDNPLTERELETGRLGPFLTEWIANMPDTCGIISTIDMARRTGVHLHGAHVVDTPTLLRMRLDPRTILEMGAIITQNTQRQANFYAGLGVKVAIFGGAVHNNRESRLSLDQYYNFGDPLSRRFGIRYVAVDIAVGNQAIFWPEELRFLQIPSESMFWPRSGANLVEFLGREQGNFAIYLPASAIEPETHCQ